MKQLIAKLSRWDRALLVLLGAFLLLWPLEPLSGFVYGLRVLLQTAIYLIAIVILSRLTYRAVRFLAGKFLWRVRHRMAVAYFFVGVIPVVLALLFSVLGVILLAGPLAAYIVGSQIEKRAAELHATANSLAWELRTAEPARAYEIGRRYVEDAQARYPGMLARFETPDGPVSVPEDFRLDAPPPALANYRGVVRRQNRLYLAAYAEWEAGNPSLLLMLPLTPGYLADLVPELGVIELNRVELTGSAFDSGLGNGALQSEPDPSPAGPPMEAKLPPPVHSLDWRIPWPARAEILDWDTGEASAYNAFFLVTRASAVVRTIFTRQSPELNNVSLQLSRALWAVFLIALTVSTVVAVSITRTVTSAVHDLYTGTQHIDRGDLRHRIPVRGHSQLTELARSFNTMAASLERLIEDSKEKQKLESELAIAREVQAQLFPRVPPTIKGLEVRGLCRPARSVSGDFYDYIDLANDRLALSFGDVSGKGISAALVMATLHSALRTQLALTASSLADGDLQQAAARLVAETNRQLCAGTAANKFATLFFALYEEPNLIYANAGHLPPILVRNGNISRLDVTGMVVGAFPHVEYSSASATLEKGDLLACFTDGVTEPENPYGEEFGESRLEQLLAREADRPLDEMIQVVLNEVDHWCGGAPEQQDDITILLARKL